MLDVVSANSPLKAPIDMPGSPKLQMDISPASHSRQEEIDYYCTPSPDLALHLLSKKQVCDMLGVAQVTVWRWVRDGHLPKPLQLGPRRIAWRTSDLQAFLTRQEG